MPASGHENRISTVGGVGSILRPHGNPERLRVLVPAQWQNQLLHFYTAVICPVLEYAVPIWHHLINSTLAQQLVSIQRRAIHISLNGTRDMIYPNVLFVAQLESLETRRNNISRSFFHGIYQPNSCLYHLIPPARDISVTTTTPFPRPILCTENTVHLYIMAYIITNQQSDSQLFHFTHDSHSTCKHAYCLF